MNTPTEMSIRYVITEVEKLGADVKLTKAVTDKIK